MNERETVRLKMTDIYRRIQFDISHLNVSRTDLRVNTLCVELTILHEMTEEFVKNV
jgi:hypothetical protein